MCLLSEKQGMEHSGLRCCMPDCVCIEWLALQSTALCCLTWQKFLSDHQAGAIAFQWAFPGGNVADRGTVVGWCATLLTGIDDKARLPAPTCQVHVRHAAATVRRTEKIAAKTASRGLFMATTAVMP